MSESVRYRIERVPVFDGTDATEWEVGIYRNGLWDGACCYDTFAEAIDAYNEATARKAER